MLSLKSLHLTRMTQLLQKDFISQKKQWEEELARNAPEIPIAPEEDENAADGDEHGRNGTSIFETAARNY